MSSTATTMDAELAAAAPPTRPYAPSWPNIVATWLERLPGPTWVAYAGVMVVSVLFSWGTAALNANLPVGGEFAVVYYAVLPFGVLALMHALDRTAGRALGSLRPLLEAGDPEIAALRYELTVAPARPAAILTLFAFGTTGLSFFIDPVGSGLEGYSPLGLFIRFVWESLVTSVFLILIYHTVRQLRRIGRIHDGIAQIDVFDQGPLYAFSSLTSRTALGVVVLLAPSVLLISSDADVPYLVLNAAWYATAVLFAATAFLLPLRGMHDRLVDEKRRLQGEVGRRLSSTVDAIHAAVDAGDDGAISTRNSALSTLIAERDLVNHIPTWPWSTGALTGFLSAVLLPLALFLAQRFLGDVLGS